VKAQLPCTRHESIIGGKEVTLLSFSTSALNGMNDQFHAPSAFSPAINTGTHWVEGWKGPVACMDGFGEDVLLLPQLEPQTVQAIANWRSLSGNCLRRERRVVFYTCKTLYNTLSASACLRLVPGRPAVRTQNSALLANRTIRIRPEIWQTRSEVREFFLIGATPLRLQ
jgi:hypothetical protein